MCGIIGYIGTKPNAINILLKGLDDLSHRGYDSMGLACVVKDEVLIAKKGSNGNGSVCAKDIENLLTNTDDDCYIGIGHTRWATFGEPNDINAHPHQSNDKKIIIVHNGNMDNYSEIKELLNQKNINIKSDTDTELIANLLSLNYEGNMISAIEKTMNKVDGAHAIVVLNTSDPEKLYAYTKGGSILIGKTKDGIVVTSDPIAFPDNSIKPRHLKTGEIATINSFDWEIKNLENYSHDSKNKNIVANKNYRYLMEKEIFEQPEVLFNTTKGRLIKQRGVPKLGGIENVARELRNVKTFHFVGCGTAYNACKYAELLLQRFGIQARSWIASELIYSHPAFDPSDVFVFVSQSGETADSITSIEEIKMKGNLTLGVVNVVGSKISQITDYGIYTRAGVEKGVASTKAFTAQLSVLSLLGIFLARQKGMTIDTGQKIIEEIEILPSKIDEIFKQTKQIKKLAKKYSKFHDFYFLGRYFNSIVGDEGALKLKEISYLHAESYPLGEMKHGPLALVDENFVSVVIIPNDSVFKKSLVNISEIKARKGRVLAITNESVAKELKSNVDDIIIIPETLEYLSPILSVIPLQLLSLFIAIELGKNPDKPRNLAKTVTVE